MVKLWLSRFLRWLGVFLRLPALDLAPRLADVPLTAPWTVLDRDRWRAVLNSDVGRRMLNRARAIEAHNAITACADVMHTSHSAGCAKGFSDCLLWLQSLANATEQNIEVQQDDGPETVDDLLERLSQ